MKHLGIALIDPSAVFEKMDLQKGMRVADFGCGRTGQFVFPTANVVGEKGIVYAVDVLKDVLENIQKNARSAGFSNIETVWADLEKVGQTPLPDASLDAGFLVNILFLVNERMNVVQETSRLIKPGGKLAIIEWKKPLGLLPPPSMINREEILDLAEVNGLQLVDTANPGEYHFCLIFKRA